MIKRVIDNRKFRAGTRCDAVVEVFTNLNLSEDHKVIRGFESEEIDYILQFSQNLKIQVIVYLYDLNSKPLK
jgi:uncharacterized linocin/CFP29 family protein